MDDLTQLPRRRLRGRPPRRGRAGGVAQPSSRCARSLASTSSPTPTSPRSGPSAPISRAASPITAFSERKGPIPRRGPAPTRRRRGSWTRSTAPPITSTIARSIASPSACRSPASWSSASSSTRRGRSCFTRPRATAPGWATGVCGRVRRPVWTRRCWRPASRPTCAARSATSTGGVTFRSTRGRCARTGSTAINLAWLAAGRFDGFWAFDNHVWDVAGGVVLVREAGGVLTAVDGGAYDPFSNEALASNGPLHPALLDALRKGPNPGS